MTAGDASRASGFLVACEGIDGSGKSTLAKGIVRALRAEGVVVARGTSEPSATWLGEAVRRALTDDSVSPWTDALLFMADHATHVAQVEEWLAEGEFVVTDRWAESTFAYQGAMLTRDGFDAVKWLQDAERPFNRDPDLVILLDLPVEEAVRRVSERGEVREKFEKAAFLERVRANYQRLAKEAPERYVTLDATRPPSALVDDAVRLVKERAGARYGGATP